MFGNKLSELEAQNCRTVYQELCNSYRAIDEFRTKLLGLLPLATGTGIFILIMDEAKFSLIKGYLSYVGIFGFVVTLGLLFYELYGIKKCTRLIREGRYLEIKLGNNDHGQFSTRPTGVLLLINEPAAASIIYPAVLAAWVFIGYFKKNNFDTAACNAVGVFIISFAIVFSYNLFLVKDDIINFWNEHFSNKKS